ncbi:MAG: molecular chaperone TorD family protein [Phyllobacteriaceae bacterium]|nr:molecular chaperone TorD family protein [Phyllobacteriaceae bacterium]
MSGLSQTMSAEQKQVLSAAADDLLLLARLHDREPDMEMLQSLSSTPARDWFALQVKGEGMEQGLGLLDDGLSDLSPLRVDELWVDYADLYLTFGKRIAPNESYWLTEDHIERQDPMFDVRGWYAHYALAAKDWRMRPDDHLVHEIEFVATLLRKENEVAIRDAGRFMDGHLLLWSADFLGGAAQRAQTPFYAGLALVTEACLLAVRSLVEGITGEPRRQHIKVQPPSADASKTAPFLPGAEPSW